jgi:hypothetical protein
LALCKFSKISQAKQPPSFPTCACSMNFHTSTFQNSRSNFSEEGENQ